MELAGLCSWREAAVIGHSVDESVRRLLRLYRVEKRLFETAIAHLPSTPGWETKCALALHQWLDVQHADAIRRRIAEMRSPPPRMDVPPDAALETFCDELLRARDTVELIGGLRYAHGALRDAYRVHIAGSNPLVDHPTRRMLHMCLVEEEETLAWYDAALAELDDDARRKAGEWAAHLGACLGAAGGIDGTSPSTGLPEELRAAEPFIPDGTPRRDQRFRGTHDFEFPPQVVYNAPDVPADERNLALLCRRTLEMDVPEVMASFMSERRDRPWEFYVDYARQLWDEARHAMMGSVGLRARGVDFTDVPLNVGFSLRLNRHAEPMERQILLYAIEQSLMPAETGKRFEYETAVEAGDELSAHFHDFDWADEVLHARIGRRWLKDEGIDRAEAIRRGEEIHERTWAALAQHQRPERDQWEWWRGFVREVLGKESVAVKPDADRPDVVRTSG